MEEDPQRAQSKCDRALVWIIWFPFPLLVLSLVACAGAWLASILAVFLFSWVTTVAALFFRLLVYASCIFFVVAVVLRVTSLAYGHLSFPVLVQHQGHLRHNALQYTCTQQLARETLAASSL